MLLLLLFCDGRLPSCESPHVLSVLPRFRFPVSGSSR